MSLPFHARLQGPRQALHEPRSTGVRHVLTMTPAKLGRPSMAGRCCCCCCCCQVGRAGRASRPHSQPLSSPETATCCSRARAPLCRHATRLAAFASSRGATWPRALCCAAAAAGAAAGPAVQQHGHGRLFSILHPPPPPETTA
eukprot:365124-Chlamydomonas_euryale.AAC.8